MTRLLGIVAAWWTIGAPAVSAQDATAEIPRPARSAHSVSFGAIDEALILSYRANVMWGDRGLDLGISTLPQAVAHGALVAVPQVGPTLLFPGSGVRLFLKGGVAGAVVLAGEFSGAVGLFYFGGGAWVTGTTGNGIRIDWTSYVTPDGERLGLFELGFGWRAGGP